MDFNLKTNPSIVWTLPPTKISLLLSTVVTHSPNGHPIVMPKILFIGNDPTLACLLHVGYLNFT